MIFALSDKVLKPWLEGKEYVDCSDEAEAIGMAAGYYLATARRATVAISADGLMNCMNFLTSWIVPENIPLKLVISTGRTEPQHKVATEIVGRVIKTLTDKYGATRLYTEFVR